MDRRGIFLGLGFAALVVASAACSSSGGTGATTPRPTPSSSAVILGTVGNIACTAPANAVPGTYAGIETYGSVSGTMYTQYPGAAGDNGDFYTAAYTAPAGATPAPTEGPIELPSPVASSAPGAVLAIVYYGEYAVPQTAGLTTAATNGCFILETTQGFFDEGDSAHRSARTVAVGRVAAAKSASGSAISSAASAGRIVLSGTPAPSPSPFDAYGFGDPAFASPYANASDDIVDGAITSFTITNLTRTTGTGTFTLNSQAVGSALTATGTVAITGSTAFYYVPSQQSVEAFKRHSLHVGRQ